MPRKRTSDKTLPMADVAGVEKPKRARALSTTTPRRTTRIPAEDAADSISNLAGAVASNGGSQAGLDPGEIAHLAYAYWEARGDQGGSSEEDWNRAERELRARCGVAAGG